ncbi:MAG: hypothetical protein E7511_04885 [Ruminococcus sp.]|nr:hypothetical protein [Ruminococcus sp.]
MENGHNTAGISPELLAQYGIRAGFLEEKPQAAALQEQGYEPMPESAFGYLGMLMQAIPDLVNGVASQDTYHVIYDKTLGHLQRDKSGRYFRANVVASGTNNDIVEQAVLQKASAAPMAVGMIFTAMSAITGQYFLAEINASLSSVGSNVEGIYQFLDTEKRSRLWANEQFLRQIMQSLLYIQENAYQKQASLNRLQDIRINSMADVDFYARMISYRTESLPKLGSKQDAVEKCMKEIHDKIPLYYYAVYLFALSYYLETVLSGNTDSGYIAYVKEEIHKAVASYQEHVDSFVEKTLHYLEENYRPDEMKNRVKKFAAVTLTHSFLHNPALGVVVSRIVDEKSKEKKKAAQEEAKRILISDLENQCEIASVAAIENYLTQYDLLHNQSTIEILCMADGSYIRTTPMQTEQNTVQRDYARL